MLDEYHQHTDPFITDPLPRQIPASRRFLYMGMGFLLIGLFLSTASPFPIVPYCTTGLVILLAIIILLSPRHEYLRFETDRIILAK